jgi:hypothetical protein
MSTSLGLSAVLLTELRFGSQIRLAQKPANFPLCIHMYEGPCALAGRWFHSNKEKTRCGFNAGKTAALSEGGLIFLQNHTPLNQRVPGSSPGAPTKFSKHLGTATESTIEALPTWVRKKRTSLCNRLLVASEIARS